ncbi:MAG: FHA domain-containing protein [Deltaproteobacteria bacterium]|nr:FHA domain-containing protein [Deltaproteobacteria bacterium]
MAPLGYIEILDPKGRVSVRHPIDAFPVTIGRGYTNQIILDDPYVCPEHVTITQSEMGRLVVDDLGSVNGLRTADDGKTVKNLPLHSGGKFRIGHTTLRYCTAVTPVAATQIDRIDLFSRLASPYIALAAGVVVLLALALDFFLANIDRVTVLRVITEPLVAISMMAVWAGIWSFVSRIVFGRLYYAQHFLITCAAMLVSLFFNESSEWLEFLVPNSHAVWAASVFGSAAILAVSVFAHLSYASGMRWTSRLYAGLLVSMAVIGVSAITEYANREKFSTVMEYSGVVKPMDARFLPARSLDQFMSRTAPLKKELDQLLQKAQTTQR